MKVLYELPVLATPRLILRGMTVDDITLEYKKWINDPDVTKYLEIRFDPQTDQKIREFLKYCYDNVDKIKHFGVFFEDELVGNVTINDINYHHKSAWISYIIGHPKAHSKGFATEAVFEVCRYAVNDCGIRKLFAGYYDGHVQSARVLEKCGFVIEGVFKNALIDYLGVRVDKIVCGLYSGQ